MLAHEASHLEHRHPWWVLAAELAAAVNPLLGPTARTAAHAVERWATKMPPPLLPIVPSPPAPSLAPHSSLAEDAAAAPTGLPSAS